MTADAAPRTFSLEDAERLLPTVKRLTTEAARQADQLAERLDGLADTDPERARLSQELSDLVNTWAAEIRSLGLEAKGLWLVDFDNGDGYYCWAHPEPAITHYHGYEDGFAGRMKIV